MFPRVLWDQRLTLNTPLNKLPLDASLVFELYGTVTVKRENSDTEMEKEQELCKKKISIFDFRRRLLAGQKLIKLEMINAKYLEPIVYVELPDLKIEFPEIRAKHIVIDKSSLSSPEWPRAKSLLNTTFNHEDLTEEEKSLVWAHRIGLSGLIKNS